MAIFSGSISLPDKWAFKLHLLRITSNVSIFPPCDFWQCSEWVSRLVLEWRRGWATAPPTITGRWMDEKIKLVAA
jgi:hypothetical protein